MRCPYLALKVRPYLAFRSTQPSRGLLFSLYSLSLEVRSTCPPLVRTREPFAGSMLCGCRSLHGLILPCPSAGRSCPPVVPLGCLRPDVGLPLQVSRGVWMLTALHCLCWSLGPLFAAFGCFQRSQRGGFARSLTGLQDSHRCLEVLDSQTRKIALSWLSR